MWWKKVFFAWKTHLMQYCYIFSCSGKRKNNPLLSDAVAEMISSQKISNGGPRKGSSHSGLRSCKYSMVGMQFRNEVSLSDQQVYDYQSWLRTRLQIGRVIYGLRWPLDSRSNWAAQLIFISSCCIHEISQVLMTKVGLIIGFMVNLEPKLNPSGSPQKLMSKCNAWSPSWK